MSAPLGLPYANPAPVTIQAPPDQDETTQHVVEILLAGAALASTAALLGRLLRRPAHIVAAALAISATAHEPRAATPMKDAARREVYYRAAYIMNAVDRIKADLDEGQSLPAAIRTERRIYSRHAMARKNRLAAVNKALVAAGRFGPLLGWYLNPMLNNEAECIAANGHNFYADRGTVIGYPGAVHPNCGCVAGPPHAGADLVDDALVRAPDVSFEHPRKVPLRRRVA